VWSTDLMTTMLLARSRHDFRNMSRKDRFCEPRQPRREIVGLATESSHESLPVETEASADRGQDQGYLQCILERQWRRSQVGHRGNPDRGMDHLHLLKDPASAGKCSRGLMRDDEDSVSYALEAVVEQIR
jgi:hypothetical protein